MKRPIPTFKEVAYGEPNVLTKRIWLLFAISGLFVFMNLAYAQQKQRGQTSYMKVDITESFPSIMARMTAAAPQKKQDLVTFLRTL
jgi:hypothetical protein